jgi:hypothetical protein
MEGWSFTGPTPILSLGGEIEPVRFSSISQTATAAYKMKLPVSFKRLVEDNAICQLQFAIETHITTLQKLSKSMLILSPGAFLPRK